MRNILKSLAYIFTASFLLTGCGKGDSVSESPSPQPSPQPASISLNTPPKAESGGTVAPPPAGTAAPAAAAPQVSDSGGQTDDSGQDLGLQELNSALSQYVENFDAMPRTLEDMVKHGYISAIPRPPAGKRYQIDHSAKKIVIAN